jgi:ABC-type Fe3+ transport system permease subunit/DNA-binding beta-propeller fold protein YncE
VKIDSVFIKITRAASLFIWAVMVLLPLITLFICALNPSVKSQTGVDIYPSLIRSFLFSVVVSVISVLLGWIPGRLLGTCHARKDLLLLLLLMPLVLPRYLLYYAWWLLLNPTTSLGAYLSDKTEVARLIGTLSSILVLIMWYWPLAALLLAQGWRNIDKQIWDSASLDTSGFRIFRNITLPLLRRPVFLAFGVCFVMSLSEFGTFNLAGIKTIGTELAVLYELTGSEALVARASWPVAVSALILAIILGQNSRTWTLPTAAIGTVEFKSQKWRWIFLFVLISISLLIPVILLISNVSDSVPFQQFIRLHLDELGWSFAIAAAAAVLAFLFAYSAYSLLDARNSSLSLPVHEHKNRIVFRLLSLIICSSIFLVMFLPGSIAAISILKISTVLNLPMFIRQSWFIVSVGLACRFAGIAFILLLLTRYSHGQTLSEMALTDGASQFQIFRYIHLPHIWPLLAGSFLLIMMFSMTELAATMVLLPAGLPNFAQRLLNQMHYARDQQVIASCLILIGFFLIMTLVLTLLLRLVRLRWLAFVLTICVCLFSISGCDNDSPSYEQTKVLNYFAVSGQGEGEFVYPRAIDIASDGTVYVVDKTGRVQQFTPDGKYLNGFKMPQTESGKPVGISFGPDGNLYVADTHYYRVMVMSPKGEVIRQWGKFGREDGCFIYPTDVEFSGDGRIFVSEYGGNDRISVFDEQGNFLYTFGSSGSGQGQLSRPSALCVDKSRNRLYVADACNHRIAVYDFDGNLKEYFGTSGLGAGQLRYPYGLDILEDGTLVVCENGNNRIQLFSPAGQSLGIYGKAGRNLGELAYPWGIAVDVKGNVYVVDAGNNRIQVWRL